METYHLCIKLDLETCKFSYHHYTPGELLVWRQKLKKKKKKKKDVFLIFVMKIF